jgi:hypothetical protein
VAPGFPSARKHEEITSNASMLVNVVRVHLERLLIYLIMNESAIPPEINKRATIVFDIAI